MTTCDAAAAPACGAVHDPLSAESSPAVTAQQRLQRRWLVGLMLFTAAILNYIDRSVLGIVAPVMQKQLGISDQGYANVANAFLLAYTLSYLFSGRLIDRIGARLSLAIFVGFWSISNALTGCTRSVLSLGVCRFMLGLGEAGGYTGSPKAVSEWFAPQERGVAIGLYSLGGSLGATIAPLLIAATSASYGWRGAFALTGALGLLWIVPWLWIARVPASACAVQTKIEARPRSEWDVWKWLLRQPAVWRLMIARLLTDAVWYFFIFWMPKYLAAMWNVTQAHMGVMFYIFLAADVGFIGGGLLSGLLVRRGVGANRSRVRIMMLAACLVPLSAAVPQAASLPVVIGLAAAIAMAHCTWLGNISTLVIDIVPPSRLATAFGLIAAGSAAGGIAMNALVSWAIGHYSYNVVFYVMAVLHPIALMIVLPLRSQRVLEDK